MASDEITPVSRPHHFEDQVMPHRGSMIMVLGILSLVMFGIILGPIAWIMGRNDLQAMDEGRMDPSGRDNTNTGRICGMIATILHGTSLVLGLFCCVGYVFIVGAALTVGANSASQVAPPPVPEVHEAAPLNVDKTYTLNPGEVKTVTVDGPPVAQQIKVTITSSGPVDVYIASDDDTDDAAERVAAPKNSYAAKKNVLADTLRAKVPADRDYGLVLINAARPNTRVTVKIEAEPAP